MRDPADTTPAELADRPLDQLRGQFPGYVIDLVPDRWRRAWRYVATARDLATSPTCVISPDPAELAAALSGEPG